jgi:UDP-N-acetylmuramoyl-tripeptide--D-alanyl-D-alanine ligase
MTSIEILYQHFLKNPIVCTDTRNIIKNCLFFALKGENFDANHFASTAIEQGASVAVIDNPDFAIGDNYILVDDVLSTLQQLAQHHRQQLNIPVIGLTGSNGKTTTKELIKAVLAEKFKTFATKGNLNNHIGVPLSLLSITPDTEIAVIEMGANHQKEIESLCEIAQPTHGLITNVGMAHLDGFGGFEGVKKGKAELYAYLKKTAGITFVYRDNQHLMEMVQKADLEHLVYYGTDSNNQVGGKLLATDPLITLSWTAAGETHHAEANITGTYNFENILAAICIGQYFKLSPSAINTGLANYFPNNNRSQLTKTETNTIICDFYNANPSSMTVALNNLNALTATHKTAIIGDMFELGKVGPAQHQKIAAQAIALGFDTLILIGQSFFAFRDGSNAHFFNTPNEASEYIKTNPIKNSLVLLKGSRGMALEQLMPLL